MGREQNDRAATYTTDRPYRHHAARGPAAGYDVPTGKEERSSNSRLARSFMGVNRETIRVPDAGGADAGGC